MRAILLAAGFGTRLRPLTDSIPKCLVTIKDKPLLGIWLERLTSAGIGPFLVNTHYLSEKVETFIENSRFDKVVTIVNEKILLGTAGTLLSNLNFFQEQDGLLIHADNYCLADFGSFIEAHLKRPKCCLMTMMTFQTQKPETCGIVELNSEGVVIGFHEKVSAPPGNLANGAVYLLSAELLSLMRSKFSDTSDFSTQVLNNLVGKIYSYETKEHFIDIGTPETYALANSL